MNKQSSPELFAYDEEIVTGEGVALELPSATVLSRIVSGTIDYGLYALGLWALLAWLSSTVDIWTIGGTSPIYRIALILAMALMFWIVPALVTGLTRGSSLGKLITSTRTVRQDGGTLTMRQSFIRHLVSVVEVWMTLGMLALAASVLSKRGSRLGDSVAGTYVVRWPKRRLSEIDVDMPPHLVTWASMVQTRSLPSALSNLISDHLRRRDKMEPSVRQRHAATLAARAEEYVSPPPPWGTPAEDFLNALTIIRTHHNIERGERQQNRYRPTLESLSEMPYGLQVPILPVNHRRPEN